MMKFIFTFFSLWIFLISKSFASNSTYLCEYDDGYLVEPKNIVNFPSLIPNKSFLVRLFDSHVIIKPTKSSRKTKLKLYRKSRTTDEKSIAYKYTGNHYMTEDVTLNFSIFINPQDSLILARLINLQGVREINVGFYTCTKVDF